MRSMSLVVLAALTVAAAASPSVGARVGVGVVAGEPTGLSFKWWQDGGTAIDMATGWSLSENDLYVHADYLWHRLIEDKEIGGSVPLYYGIGARVLLRDDEDSKAGVRIPVGLDLTFDDGRFDVFVEIAPIFNLVPDTEFDLSGGVGARFWF